MAKLVDILEGAAEPGRIFIVFECSAEQKARWRVEATKQHRTLSSFIRSVLETATTKGGKR